MEPVVLAASRTGEILLAGTPNYLWSRSRSGKGIPAGSNRVFGAVLGADGVARTIPAPVDAKLVTGIRAAERPDGAWDFVFAERERPGGGGDPEIPVTRLWYGIYNGNGWDSLRPLPLPDEGRPHPFTSSSLVRRGDTVAWAMAVDPSEGMARIIVFERRSGRWSSEIVPTHAAAYPALAYSDTLGFLLAAVQPDRSLRSDHNSLFLFIRRTTWQLLRRVIHGELEGPVHHPSLSFTPAGGVLTWVTAVPGTGGMRWEARALLGPIADGSAQTVTLDSATAWSIVPITMSDGTRLWVTDHVLPAGREHREIRFIGYSGQDGVLDFGRIPTSYVGSFGVTPSAPSELLISGPLIDHSDSLVVSLLLRARLHCGETVP